MPYDFGTVVLLPFPFTNQSASKRRPAVIVSVAAYNAARPDVVVMAVTSQLRPAPEFGEVWIGQWRLAGLLKPSAIKPVFATIEQGLIIRPLGSLGSDDRDSLREAITRILGA